MMGQGREVEEGILAQEHSSITLVHQEWEQLLSGKGDPSWLSGLPSWRYLRERQPQDQDGNPDGVFGCLSHPESCLTPQKAKKSHFHPAE